MQSENRFVDSTLHSQLNALSEKVDRMHKENRDRQEMDRDTFRDALATQQTTFTAAMNAQREAFSAALAHQYSEHVAIVTQVNKMTEAVKMVLGNGQPGEGRLGALETAVETLKKFRWQALAVIGVLMWATEFVARMYGGK
jgi:hypothetical protein